MKREDFLKCKVCPFCVLSIGYRKTTLLCAIPRCLREYDRKIRKIRDKLRVES